MFDKENLSVYYNAPRQLNNKYSPRDEYSRRGGYYGRDRYSTIEEDDNSVCPLCGSTNFTFYPSENQTLCECGCVIEEDLIDRSFNGLSYSQDGSNKTHNGSFKVDTLHDGGLTTTIATGNRGLNGSQIVAAYRLRKAESRNRVVSNKERNLTSANTYLKTIKSHLNLSKDVANDAARFYKAALEADEIHGRSIDDMMAASVYLACKASHPRSAKEISAVTNTEPMTIIRYSKIIKQYVDVKYRPTSPVSFIPRFVSNLNLPKEVEAKAIELVNLLDENQLGNGTQPSSYAAAAIYVACKNLRVKISQKRIVEACDVSETTIRKQSKVIKGMINS